MVATYYYKGFFNKKKSAFSHHMIV